MTKLLHVCLLTMLCLCQTSFANHQEESASYETTTSSVIQRVRIDFVTPLGFTRHLLLAFTSDNAATDAVDYGYDASNIENLPDDLNWIIEEGRYVIQGVGAFDSQKTYPLGMFLSNSGSISIKLDRLENFDEAIDVFILDKENNTYSKISEFDLDAEMEAGDYTDRFFIAFSKENDQTEQKSTLGITDVDTENPFSVSYQNSTDRLVIGNHHQYKNITISLFDISGKRLISIKDVSDPKIYLSVKAYKNQALILRIRSEEALLHKQVLLH